MSTLMGTDFDRDETTVLNDERMDAYTVGDEPDRALMYAWTVGELRDQQCQTILARAEADMNLEASTAKTERIDWLVGRIGALEDDLHRVERNHQADITLIGEKLLAEAQEREWCSQYDDAVQELNRRLHRPLPLRNTTYKVRVIVYLEIPDCENQDEAEHRAREYVNSGDDSETSVADYDLDQIEVDTE